MSPLRYVWGMVRKSLAGAATAYVAGELRAQKARLRWSLDDIAERSGLGRSTVDRALKGSGDISVEALVALCAAMGLDVGAVLRGAVDAAGDA